MMFQCFVTDFCLVLCQVWIEPEQNDGYWTWEWDGEMWELGWNAWGSSWGWHWGGWKWSSEYGYHFEWGWWHYIYLSSTSTACLQNSFEILLPEDWCPDSVTDCNSFSVQFTTTVGIEEAADYTIFQGADDELEILIDSVLVHSSGCSYNEEEGGYWEWMWDGELWELGWNAWGSSWGWHWGGWKWSEDWGYHFEWGWWNMVSLSFSI